jgi:hypothetical protein
MRWSIGIYTGDSPLALLPAPGVRNPVLTPEHATDVAAGAVADPFLLRAGDTWYLFLEVLNTRTGRGEIAYATSADGLAWSYRKVVLAEPFHLSYPCVLAWENEVYLIPESRQDRSVRLYRADDFPERWSLAATLLHGPFADSTVVRHADAWWLFAQRGLDELVLYRADDLAGPWRPHPQSPLYAGDRHITRPGGRVLRLGDRLLRFAQDGLPTYGNRLHALEIDLLSDSGYAEHEVAESPVLTAGGHGWNALAMHHLDALPLAEGGWLAAVDGGTVGPGSERG